MLFFDFETQSRADLKKVGAHRYAADPSTRILLLAYAVDDGPIKTWSPDEPLPPELTDTTDQYHVAWNCEFDELIWRQCGPAVNLPKVHPDLFLDAMAQCQASLYPADLRGAGFVNHKGAQKQAGKALIEKFSVGITPIWQLKRDADWPAFVDYAIADVATLRTAWQTSAPLTAEEWEDYRVTREINDRGLPIDRAFCEAADPVMIASAQETDDSIHELTEGAIHKVTQSVALRDWLANRLASHPAFRHAVKARDRKTGEVIKYSTDRQRLTRVLEEIMASDEPVPQNVVDLMQTVIDGRNVSGKKLTKMYHMSTEDDERVYGSYNLNGAGKTGRFSSRGIQMHNLPRDAIHDEDMYIETLKTGGAGEFANTCRFNGLPVNYALSRLVRPAIMAPRGKTLVWGDWSQIEARVLPWLCGDHPRVGQLLDVFRSGEDIYRVSAALMFQRKSLEDVTKVERQAGKVAVLALGFGGGVNAYQVMARAYGLKVTDLEAAKLRDRWRHANPWAPWLWARLETAFKDALAAPMNTFTVGRVTYTYVPSIMRGTVVCQLPCGRCLMYPEAKMRTRERERPDGTITIERVLSHRDRFTYNSQGKAQAWAYTWGGTLAENITQATAASLLRRSLRLLRPSGWTVGHTHDEILLEVPQAHAGAARDALHEVMTDAPDWAEGLPIAADIESYWYYTKTDLATLTGAAA